MLTTITKLSGLTAPSGWEHSVREYLIEAAQAHCLSCTVDRLGNLLIQVPGKKKPKQPILLVASMDEPGLMIEEITEKGLLKFGLMGETGLRTILGRQIHAGDRGVKGVIGLKPIHLTGKEERKTLPKAEDLYIDLGVSTKADAENLTEVGEMGVFDQPILFLGEYGVFGKAMERSVGCAALLALMDEALPVDVTLAFTVQRQVGNRGAYALGYESPEGIAVVLELCPGDTAGEQLPKLGGGAVIPAMDAQTIFDRELVKRLTEGAKRGGASVQLRADVPVKGDGGAIQRGGAGQRVAAICCPADCIHAPGQRIDRRDVQQLPKLLLGFLEEEAQ